MTPSSHVEAGRLISGNVYEEELGSVRRVMRQRATAEVRLASIDAGNVFTRPEPGQEVFKMMMTAVLQKAAAVALLRSEPVRLLACGGVQ